MKIFYCWDNLTKVLLLYKRMDNRSNNHKPMDPVIVPLQLMYKWASPSEMFFFCRFFSASLSYLCVTRNNIGPDFKTMFEFNADDKGAEKKNTADYRK